MVCSNIPSLVEVGGRGVFHVNPLDESDIAQGIIYLLSNPIKRNQLITLGKDNLKKYDWERAASEFLSICDKVCKQIE